MMALIISWAAAASLRCVGTSSPKVSVPTVSIQLLNSKVIDVDKLDYLIRDAYITGYCTVNIDYMRLLASLTVVSEGSDTILFS